MDSDSENESIEGEVEIDKTPAEWGKSKRDYYYTDYVDKDYPSKLTAKEEKLAAIEQEEALRIQKKLLSTLDNVDLEHVAYNEEEDACSEQEDLIAKITEQNRTVVSQVAGKTEKRKRVHFAENENDEDSLDDGDIDDDNNKSDQEKEFNADEEDEDEEDDKVHDVGRQRRPINTAIKKNRGLTPYKKKEYRNPRVKHKLKYKKAMSKRRRVVREVAPQLQRYSGETAGIKTSTIKSIKLN